MQSDTLPWFYIEGPIPLHTIGIKEDLAEPIKNYYNNLLSVSHDISPTADAILSLIWDEHAANPTDLKKFFIASIGQFSRDPEIARQIGGFYDDIIQNLYGEKPIPKSRHTISAIYRLLRFEVEKVPNINLLARETAILVSRHAAVEHSLPEFIFYVKLRLTNTPNHPLLREHTVKWQPWLQPHPLLGFAFTQGNWATLGEFREVVDAVLGRHLEAHPPELLIYKDLGCSCLAVDNEPLSGNFYILLTLTDLLRCPRVPRGKAPKWNQKVFATAVNDLCGNVCAVGSSTQDLEAAHILPRTAHQYLSHLLETFTSKPIECGIDAACNGICLWVAVHRPWDRGRAALSPSRKLAIFAQADFGLAFSQFRSLSTSSLNRDTHDLEFQVFLKLRYTISLLEWFASPVLRDLLRELGPNDLPDPPSPPLDHNVSMDDMQYQSDEEDEDGKEKEEEPDHSPPRNMSGQERASGPDEAEGGGKHISPSTFSTSNSLNEHSTISTATTSTALTEVSIPPRSRSNSATTIMPSGPAGGNNDEEDDSEEEEEEEEEEYGAVKHWAGCPCDLQAADGPDDPCIGPLVGMMQVWAGLRTFGGARNAIP